MDIFDFLDELNIEYRNKALIEQAFIHSSYVNEHKAAKGDNERLEFMGDAVLQIWISTKLFKIEPPLSEGKMTTKRANLVCEKALATYVREFGLNRFLKLGAGEEKTGGRNRDSVIADMFEAFIGAVYIDTGMANVSKLLEILINKHIHTYEEEDEIDYKTKLQEYVQADSRKSIVYEIKEASGPSNNPNFVFVVKIDGLVYGEGSGHSKKEAQKAAAKEKKEKMVK